MAPSDWKPLSEAPCDEWVLLATTGEWVGQAMQVWVEDPSGDDEMLTTRWEWADSGGLHPNHKPLGWMPLPEGLTKEVA